MHTGWYHHFHFVIVFIRRLFLQAKRTADYSSVLIHVTENASGTRKKSGITFGENWDTARSDMLLHISSLWMCFGTHNVRIKKQHSLFFTHIPAVCCNSCKDTFLKVCQGSFSGQLSIIVILREHLASFKLYLFSVLFMKCGTETGTSFFPFKYLEKQTLLFHFLSRSNIYY